MENGKIIRTMNSNCKFEAHGYDKPCVYVLTYIFGQVSFCTLNFLYKNLESVFIYILFTFIYVIKAVIGVVIIITA